MTLLAAHRRFEQGGDAYLGIILAPSDLGLSASLSIALLILFADESQANPTRRGAGRNHQLHFRSDRLFSFD